MVREKYKQCCDKKTLSNGPGIKEREKNIKMKKSYKISRVIIAVITFIIFSIISINEDESWNIMPLIFAGIAWGLSFPSTLISRKLIKIGNKLKSIALKILYYVIVLPVIAFLIFYGMYGIGLFAFEINPTPNEMGAALGQALIILFCITVGTICIVLPYIQTLIVLILKGFVKDE